MQRSVAGEDLLGAPEDGPGVAVARTEAPGDLEGGGQAHGLGPPHSAHRCHLGHVAPRHLLERAELGEEGMRHIEGAHAPDARAELYGEELAVRRAAAPL